MPKLRDRTEVDKRAAVMTLALSALADSLWNASQMTSEEVALQCLTSGAASAREILKTETSP